MANRYTKEAILANLRTGIAVVTFKKENGEKRELECTLMEQFLPKKKKAKKDEVKKIPNPELVVAWDVVNEGWRSFRLDSVIKITGMLE